MPVTKCNGLVTNNLAGIASMIEYAHEDGSVCARPGPRDLPVGSLVESEFEIVYSVCEHTIVAVHEFAPEPEARPAPPTVQKIVQAIERKQAPKAQSKGLVKIPSYMMMPPEMMQITVFTKPVAKTSVDKLPVEQRYEFNLDPEELAELNAIRGIDEPIGGGAPTNPFDSNFSASPKQQPQAPRKGNKPVSVFDR